MTQEEILKAIQNATCAIKLYRGRTRGSSVDATTIVNRILGEDVILPVGSDEHFRKCVFEELLPEVIGIGLPGKTCPRCNGTGKINEGTAGT